MIDEKISAYLDGEASRTEVLELLARVKKDPELRHALERHHRLRAGLHGLVRPGLDAGFADRVMERIAADAATPKVVRLRERPVFRMATGLALAASVAGIAVIGLQSLPTQTGPVSTPVATVAAPTTVAAEDIRFDELPPEVLEEINDYLISHNNAAADHGLGSAMGFMRVAAHEGGEE
jgi:negative regulator of sigma E activity